MKFLVIHKDKIYNIPPLISAMYILCDLGHEVELITCGVNEQLQKEFSSKQIKYTILPYSNAKNNFFKVYEYLKFKKEVKKILTLKHDHILWIEGANTIRALGNVIKSNQYILQISELNENSKPQLRAIGKVIKEAKIVFMPEYNRSVLYQVWFGLKTRPVVLPNKPYFVPDEKELKKLMGKYEKQLKQIEGKKVVLYQGYIGKDRDISPIVKAVKRMGNDFIVLAVGKDCDMIREYQMIDPRIVHIDFMPAPDYLLFTSIAYIGVLSYVPDCMNNIFCAPNKIFEYSAFGLPMIGNDIPGLKTLEYENAGVVVDVNDEDSVLAAIRKIDANYSVYSKSAKALYDKTDNMETIKKALEKI